MKRALEISRFGLGYVSPNPLVGCVLVKNKNIIGEGWHRQIGQAHAEVNAVSNVSDHTLLDGSTAYVTLEPCSHHGRTPPCTDLLINKGIKRVVVSLQDPFERVNGKGIAKLRENGVKVDIGLFQDEAAFINRRFLTNVNKSRPYVILKWAQTSNGFIARNNYDSKWISSEQSRQLVHRWRAEEDGILVGYSTAKYDNPTLNVRTWSGQNPKPIFIDPSLSLKGIQLYDCESICINELKSEVLGKCLLVKVKDTHNIPELLQSIQEEGIFTLIVEGGSKTLRSFIKQDVWDEARVFTSSLTFADGIQAPIMEHDSTEVEMIGPDKLEYFYNS